MKQDPLSCIDLSRMPKWDFSVRVRGMEIPMISPLDAPDMNAVALPTQEELDAKTQRWPGIFVWLKRAIFGSPRIDIRDLPTDGGASHIREVCRVILGEEFEDLVNELKTGECAIIFSAYMGAQTEFLFACEQYAAQLASEHLRSANAQSADSGPANSQQVQIVPGQPYPFEAKLNPAVYDEDGGLRK